jgi:hypothetical protein
MWDSYYYRKAIHRHWYSRYRLRLYTIFVFILLLIVGAVTIALDLLDANKKVPPPTSKLQTSVVANPLTTITTPYFTFKDTGKWILDKNFSTPTKFVYTKFDGLLAQYELYIYVNQVPIPNDLVTTRVLPVRIVNNNSFDVTTVSNPCVSYYAPGDPKVAKIIQINVANMFCNPDSEQYKVVVSQITGNYQLPMMRADGTPVQFIIIYYDGTQQPGQLPLINLMNTFTSR